MTEVEVLGCGVISWKPPSGNEGLALGYIVRFFDGATYDASGSGYRSAQRYLDDIGRHWARAENMPTDGRTIYVDVSTNNPLCILFIRAFTIIGMVGSISFEHVQNQIKTHHLRGPTSSTRNAL